jgi:hypothetical protein
VRVRERVREREGERESERERGREREGEREREKESVIEGGSCAASGPGHPMVRTVQMPLRNQLFHTCTYVHNMWVCICIRICVFRFSFTSEPPSRLNHCM